MESFHWKVSTVESAIAATVSRQMVSPKSALPQGHATVDIPTRDIFTENRLRLECFERRIVLHGRDGQRNCSQEQIREPGPVEFHQIPASEDLQDFKLCCSLGSLKLRLWIHSWR